MPSPRTSTPAQKSGAKKPPAKKARPKKRAPKRAPLRRDRVLDAALMLADARGLEAVSMRELARALGVEAMSLYKHVSSKDALLDGLAERVLAEMWVPEPTLDWRPALRGRAISSRSVLLRHPWAALLIESRVHPGPARLRLHDATLGALRRAGFPVELAYRAYLTLDSYVIGFVQQELSWPFEPDERPEMLEALAPRVSPRTHPHLVEVMHFVGERLSIGPLARRARWPTPRSSSSGSISCSTASTRRGARRARPTRREAPWAGPRARGGALAGLVGRERHRWRGAQRCAGARHRAPER
jgi:AcrR family transcriptional regulator